jgi:nucleoid DNA-binding protein
MSTVTKKDIVKEVARMTGYDTQSIKDVVQTMFDCMCEGLAKDGNIEIRNFGIFKVKSTPERQARNPKTSEIITVPAKKHIHFKPGQEMKVLINRPEYNEEKKESPEPEPLRRTEPTGEFSTPFTEPDSGQASSGETGIGGPAEEESSEQQQPRPWEKPDF